MVRASHAAFALVTASAGVCIALAGSAQAGNPHDNHLQWHAGTSYYEYTYEDPLAEQGATQLAIAGEKLVVTDLFWGLFVYEIQSPGVVAQRGWLDDVRNCYSLAIDASHSYLSTWSGVEIVDIEDMQYPTVVATISGLYPNDLVVDGDYLYSVGSDLRVFDVTDASNPTLVGVLAQAGSDMAILGNRGYVLDSIGLWVVDLSDPANPQLLGNAHPSSALEDIKVMDGNLLVADRPYGLRVFDLADPDAPLLISGVAGGTTYSLAAGGDGVVLGASPTVYVDLTDPGAPVTGAYLRGIAAKDGVIADGFAYVASYYDGLQIVDLRGGTGPVPAASFVQWAGARALAPFGDYLVALFDDTIELIDVSDPMSPVSVGSAHVPSGLRLDVEGDHAYVIGGSAGLRSVDLTGPGAPTIVGALAGISAEGFDATQDRLYAASNNRMYVVDISDPANPTLLANQGGFGYFISTVAAVGNTAYTCENFEGNGFLYEIDYTNPTNPVFTNTEYVENIFELGLSGDRLYAQTQQDLFVTDRNVLYPQDRLGDHDFASARIIPGTVGRIYGISNGGQFYGWVDDGALHYSFMGSPPGGGARALCEARGVLFVADVAALHVYELPPAPSSVPPASGAPPLVSLRVAPNPSTGQASFSWSLPDGVVAEGPATVRIFGPDGRLIRTLRDDATHGWLDWDGLDGRGRPVPVGVMFARLKTSTEESSQTIQIIR